VAFHNSLTNFNVANLNSQYKSSTPSEG